VLVVLEPLIGLYDRVGDGGRNVTCAVLPTLRLLW
jgi:hypothetical protein